ncbi:hypothetical protein BJ875DRAFT_431868 [Amylocarpus encephaloides]|uniref:MARVEL domain-containing protein n=1 Tax=Amylocarpus encephaloides TaxID=45428 RepID=A0A9P7YAZ9_9HELO|nr:hypothetical protein BJ875DRAFT_431868 [Amylocarpus encephaloides]
MAVTTPASHVLSIPIAFLALRGGQMVLAIVVLGLSAYGLSSLSFDAVSMCLFTAIATLIITAYNIVSFVALKPAYNYWAVLGLDIFGIIFWITSMGLMASWVSGFNDLYYTPSYSCYPFCYKKRDLVPRTIYADDSYLGAMKATAGLAGFELLLFIISLAITSVFIHKHRGAGGHCMPSSVGTTGPAGGPAGAHAEPKDIEMVAGQPVSQQQVQPPVAYAAPQQQYYAPAPVQQQVA